MEQHDVIVIGVGGMGSAAVYHLARRGVKVLGLERFDIPHEMGSSHGVTRIIRLAYWEHPSYVTLLQRAYELWREIENITGERLMIITGGIYAGAEDSDVVKGALASLTLHHLPHEQLDAATLRKRYPGYHLPGEMVAVYQPDGGLLMSERCIVSYVNAALDLGAEIHARERVLGWEPHEAGVLVRTDRGTHRASRLVLTAGAWTRELMQELTALAVPERQVLIWTQPRRPEYFRVGSFPVFSLQAPEGRFYGTPVHGIPGFKIGKYHHRREQASPDDMDRDVHPEDEAVLREGIRRYFPEADGPTMAMKTCLFTNTPDANFIIDRHPRIPQVCFAAGFSGHGFKFCSVVGEIVADLALEEGNRFDLCLFRLQRFIA